MSHFLWNAILFNSLRSLFFASNIFIACIEITPDEMSYASNCHASK